MLVPRRAAGARGWWRGVWGGWAGGVVARLVVPVVAGVWLETADRTTVAGPAIGTKALVGLMLRFMVVPLYVVPTPDGVC